MDYTIDAANKKLGRLASEISVILQGKKSPDYEPRLEGKDKVIIKNLANLAWDVSRMKAKIRYSHTTQIGHLKEKNYNVLWRENPEKVLRLAVKRMLPKNKLAPKRLKRLIVEKQ